MSGTRDWVTEGFVMGNKQERIVLCSTLDGIPYFPADTPIPLVGPEDYIQPKYDILAVVPTDEGAQFIQLGSFVGKAEMLRYGYMLDRVMRGGDDQVYGKETAE